MNSRAWVFATLLIGMVGCSHTQTRGQAADEPNQEDADLKNVKVIGDIVDVGSIDPMPLSGVGLVCDLDGTGGPVPGGEYRKMLEDTLHKQGVENVQELMNSKKHALVLVSALIPVGVRKGDSIDIEVVLPPQSKASSLRGGYLLDCALRDYDVRKTPQGGQRLLEGHILAKAHGPLLVGFNEGSEDMGLRRGRIWAGGVSRIDHPFYLMLKNEKTTTLANAVASRINAAYPDDAEKQFMVRKTRHLLVQDEVATDINERFHASNGLGHGGAAEVLTGMKGLISVNVPLEYRLNPSRYLRVVLLTPLRESAENACRYRTKLDDMLLDPKMTIAAALRLEAMGKESIPALKKGLISNETLIRFASAEALAYLGSTVGLDELGRLAEKHVTLRAACLTAMASSNEGASQVKLAELMKSPTPQVRIGAFRNLWAMTEGEFGGSINSSIRGDLLNDAYWLYKVAPSSTPMVHVSTCRRAEIVIFGQAPVLVPPFKILAGPEFHVTAEAGDPRCTVSRYVLSPADVKHKQCSFQLEDILQTMTAMGGQYGDTVELLRRADHDKCLTCDVAVDALPPLTPVELISACGSDANLYKDNAAAQQEVLAAQQDLGVSPAPASVVPAAGRAQH